MKLYLVFSIAAALALVGIGGVVATVAEPTNYLSGLALSRQLDSLQHEFHVLQDRNNQLYAGQADLKEKVRMTCRARRRH